MADNYSSKSAARALLLHALWQEPEQRLEHPAQALLKVLEQIGLTDLADSILKKALAKLGEPAKALEDAGVIGCTRGEGSTQRTAIWFTDKGPEHERDEITHRHSEAAAAFCLYLKIPVPEPVMDTETTDTLPAAEPAADAGTPAANQRVNPATEPPGESVDVPFPAGETADHIGETGKDTTGAAARLEAMQVVELTWRSGGQFPNGTEVTMLRQADFAWLTQQALAAEPLEQKLRAIRSLTANE
ncbi:MAG TPA: hypothetical protein VLI05_03700 [Candidatus Saccharimonadia bacterium]|nr:hypothetical protein [Candidatus Saccharimonadia bacterium]